MVDAVAQSLANVTISHLNSQLEAVDEAIAQTIDNDSGLQHTAVRRLCPDLAAGDMQRLKVCSGFDPLRSRLMQRNGFTEYPTGAA
jgi:hypothetical protein